LAKEYSLGVDVGSVSTNLVAVDENGTVCEKLYLKTSGRPVDTLKNGLRILADRLEDKPRIKAVGATGSGRKLAGILIGADVIKNEITTHAVAAHRIKPDVRTILEIGGQDSKIILLRNGIVYDFAMNTVCAAGTGSFLDRQAARLEIPIEDFGGYALRSQTPVRIAGRCAVFAESDMIHKQQNGNCPEDIIAGLCEALVRNYLNNLTKGKEIRKPIMFQGGVAANVGIVKAFEKALGAKILIPLHYDVMGAYGAALLAKEEIEASGTETCFLGFENLKRDFYVHSMECDGCSNLCEVVQICASGAPTAYWGDRCGKWSSLSLKASSDS